MGPRNRDVPAPYPSVSVDNERRQRTGIERRAFLGGIGGLVGAGAATGAAAAQEEQQATREVVMERQGDPWEGNYTGQFLVVTYRADDQGSVPGAVDNCEMEWGIDEATLYNANLVDRIRDDPQRRELQVWVDGTLPEIDRGTPFIVTRTNECTSQFLRLTIEAVPEDRGEEANGSGPTVPGDGTTPGGGTDGETDTGGGMPGFGALVGAAGVGGGLLLRALRDTDQ